MSPQRLPPSCALHIVVEAAGLLRAEPDASRLAIALVARFGVHIGAATGTVGHLLDLSAVFHLVWAHIGEHDGSTS